MLVVAATVVVLLLAATLLVFALKVRHHMKKATSSTPRVDAIAERQKWIAFASQLLSLCVEIHGASDVQVTEKEFAEPKILALALLSAADWPSPLERGSRSSRSSNKNSPWERTLLRSWSYIAVTNSSPHDHVAQALAP